MANWISSKLKAAESILQQIDQQAAESLRKNESSRSDDLGFKTPTKISDAVPLKDQLKKKATEKTDSIVKSRRDGTPSVLNHNYSAGGGTKGVASLSVNSNSQSGSSLNDVDWTELLGEPDKKISGPSNVNSNNVLTGIKGLRKERRRHGTSGSNSPVLERSRSLKVNALRSLKTSEVRLENKSEGAAMDVKRNGDNSAFPDSSPGTSSFELQNDGDDLTRTDRRKFTRPVANGSSVMEQEIEGYNDKDDDLKKNGNGKLHPEGSFSDGILRSVVKTPSLMPAIVEASDDYKKKSGKIEKEKSDVVEKNSFSIQKGTYLGRDEDSGSDTDSTSTSDSESEHEREEKRKRMQQILAQRAAAKAIDAIKERENMVARLEGEKESLEKILEERAKQQAQEASELQTTTIEIMEAVEMEKQKHNHTRMEALLRLAEVETSNVDLAKTLANTQWNLEIEVNRVMELRQQIELKEAAHEELRRKISNTQHTGNKLAVPKGVELEQEIVSAEYSFISEKAERLQEKAKTLERNIEMTRKDMDNPTEVETELKRRLNQLTDHLIQKQAQVEALSSEKATLIFRIEAVSKLLDENKSADYVATSSNNDLESGIWGYSNPKLRPMLKDKIISGKQHFVSLVRQLDAIFSAGASFLRRNSKARIWFAVYFVCFHIWVMFILMSHTPVSNESKSGAVFSLENFNNTGDV